MRFRRIRIRKPKHAAKKKSGAGHKVASSHHAMAQHHAMAHHATGRRAPHHRKKYRGPYTAGGGSEI